MKKSLLVLSILILSLGIIFAQGGVEKQYPSKNINVIIPKGAGGGTDTSCRVLLQFASDKLPDNVSFVPVNKPAGNGFTGMVEGANATPDGYTLVMTVVELATNPGASSVTADNFTGLAFTIANPASLIVRSDAPYQTIEEFIEYCKNHPGEVMVGNSGMGNIYHLAAAKMEKEFGIKFSHVPYNNGAGESIAALVGGHIDAVVSTPDTAKAQVDAGNLKILGVMSNQRLSTFPEVPTFKEKCGFEFNVLAWAALCAPNNLPEDVYNWLINIFTETCQQEDYKQAMRNQGIEPVEIIGEDATKTIRSDAELYKNLLTELGL